MTRMTYTNMMSMFLGEEPHVRSITDALWNTHPKDPNKNKDKDTPTTALAKKAAAQGLYHMGNIYYGPEGAKEPTHKHQNGRFMPLTPKEKAEKKNKDAANKPKKKGRASDAPNKIPVAPPTSNTRSKGTKGHSLSPEQFKVAIDYRREEANKILDRLEATLDPNNTQKHEAFEADRELYSELYNTLEKCTNMPDGKQKRDLLERIIKKYDISLNKNSGVVYANIFPALRGMYKIFSKKGVTKDTQYFITMLSNNGLTVRDSSTTEKHFKSQLSGLSKPDFGKAHNMSDPTVRELFGSLDQLNDLPPQWQSVFGPVGSDGHLLRSGGKNAKIFLEHSVRSNNSVESLILKLGAMKSSTPGDNGDKSRQVAKALVVYQKEMKNVMKNFDTYPVDKNGYSPARRKAVADIYNKLAISIFEADKNIASTIMKNLAEMNLYDQEIAEGQEVYLPADGTFPAGDKIAVTRKGTKVEQITSISVKFGTNSSMSHGMPSNTSTLCLFHQDKWFRDLFASRWGSDYNELGIKSSAIWEKSRWDMLVRTSGWDKIFDTERSNQLHQIGDQIISQMEKWKKAHPGWRTPDLEDMTRDPAMKKLWAKLYNVIGSVDQNKLKEQCGDYNYKLLMKGTYYSQAIFSYIAFESTLQTSNGLDAVAHHFEEYKKEGGYVSKTMLGSKNLRDWALDVRPWGIRAGGTSAGVNRDYEGEEI